jgi:hypothetical protein
VSDLPCNHASRFPGEWWTDRRKRDYFVDENDLVRLKPESPTAEKLRAHLAMIARDSVLLASKPIFLQ